MQSTYRRTVARTASFRHGAICRNSTGCRKMRLVSAVHWLHLRVGSEEGHSLSPCRSNLSSSPLSDIRDKWCPHRQRLGKSCLCSQFVVRNLRSCARRALKVWGRVVLGRRSREVSQSTNALGQPLTAGRARQVTQICLYAIAILSTMNGRTCELLSTAPL